MSDTSLAVRSGHRLGPQPTLPQQPPPTIRLLGPLQVHVQGVEVKLGRRQRALLALLAMNANSVVSTRRLVDQLWNGAPSPGAQVTLRSYVSNIRASLTASSRAGLRVRTVDTGYVLEVDPETIDVVQFQRLVAAGHRRLGAGDSQAALDDFEKALGLWRGEPYADVADHDVSTPYRVELTELHESAVEGRLRALLELGRHVEAVPRLEALTAEQPLREGPYELLMVALHRAGRSADALDVHRRYRRLVRDQLGIDPSARLDSLVMAILNRDPRLDATDPPHERLGTVPAGTVVETEPLAVLVRDLVEVLHTLSERTAQALQLLGTVTPVDPTGIPATGPTTSTLRPGAGAGLSLLRDPADAEDRRAAC